MTTPDEPWAFPLTIDPDRKIIAVDDYEPVPFLEESISSNVIAFMSLRQTGFGVSTGTLHRITGETSIHIMGDGLHVFQGICKPRRLF